MAELPDGGPKAGRRAMASDSIGIYGGAFWIYVPSTMLSFFGFEATLATPKTSAAIF